MSIQKRKTEIIEYLENEAHFRDYKLLKASQWRKVNKARSINLLNPSNFDLDDALSVFVRDGYSTILIYLGEKK